MLGLLLLTAACSRDAATGPIDRNARRAALGLQDTPRLSFVQAMDEIDEAGFERRLAAGKLGLDDALRLQNLLVRANAANRPDEFLSYLARTREAAGRHVDEMSEETGRILLESCVDCHVTYRQR